MVLGKLPVPGRPTIWMIVGQGPTALAVGAGGGCLDIFTLLYPFSPLSPSLCETVRYRLKYCLKGPLSPKTTNNQPTIKLKTRRPPTGFLVLQSHHSHMCNIWGTSAFSLHRHFWTGIHFKFSMLFSACNNTCYHQQGEIFSYLLNIFGLSFLLYVSFRFRKIFMPLKFINLCYDFVLFFASSLWRSRNSSTLGYSVADAIFTLVRC